MLLSKFNIFRQCFSLDLHTCGLNISKTWFAMTHHDLHDLSRGQTRQSGVTAV